MKTYVVVKVDNQPHLHGLMISRKRSTNLEEMKQHKEYFKKLFPHCQIAVMTLEKAESEKARYEKWYLDRENYLAKKWAEAYKKESTCKSYYSSGCIHSGSISNSMARLWG